MVEKTSVVLSMLWFSVMFISGQSAPVEVPPIVAPHLEEGKVTFPPLNRQKRTFYHGLLGSRDWASQFYHTWTLPSLYAVNLHDHEQLHNNFKQRISDLETNQKRIIAYLRRIQAERSIQQQCTCSEVATESTPPSTSAAPSTNSPLTSQQPPQTEKPITATTTTTSGDLREEPIVTKGQEVTPLIDIRLGDDGKGIVNEENRVEEQRTDSDKISEASTAPTTTIAEPSVRFASHSSTELNDLI